MHNLYLNASILTVSVCGTKSFGQKMVLFQINVKIMQKINVLRFVWLALVGPLMQQFGKPSEQN